MIPALKGNEASFAATWLGTIVAGGSSVLAVADVVPTQPAVYVGLGALGTAVVGLIIPLVKLYTEQRDKDRQALIESTRVAAELRTAFQSINLLDGEVRKILTNQEQHLKQHGTTPKPKPKPKPKP